MAATYPADTFQEGVDLTIEASNQLAQVVRGDANTEVTVADGSTIPSIRKAQTDSMYFKEPEAWTSGQTETDYLQLKKYIDPTTNKESWWFAKGAMASNPVAMRTSPFGNDNWYLYTPEDLFISGKAEYESIYQALKGKAAEAGYNLVRGSFEEGGTLTNTNDVLWYQSNGRYYSWAGTFPKVVAAGSTPATSGGIGAGAWVDRTDVTLRTDLASESGSELVGYQPAGTGAVARTVQDKLREVVSVKDFGAVGDGVTDDTAAFQSAQLASSRVFVPKGIYRVSGIRQIVDDLHLHGDGKGQSVIYAPSGVAFYNYTGTDSAAPQRDGLVIENLSFRGGYTNPDDFSSPTNSWSLASGLTKTFETANPNTLLRLKRATNVLIRNVSFKKAHVGIDVHAGYGIEVSNCRFYDGQIGFRCNNGASWGDAAYKTTTVTLRKNLFSNLWIGAYLIDLVDNSRSYENIFEPCNTGQYILNGGSVNGINYLSDYFERCYEGIVLNGGYLQRWVIDNPYFAGSPGYFWGNGKSIDILSGASGGASIYLNASKIGGGGFNNSSGARVYADTLAAVGSYFSTLYLKDYVNRPINSDPMFYRQGRLIDYGAGISGKAVETDTDGSTVLAFTGSGTGLSWNGLRFRFVGKRNGPVRVKLKYMYTGTSTNFRPFGIYLGAPYQGFVGPVVAGDTGGQWVDVDLTLTNPSATNYAFTFAQGGFDGTFRIKNFFASEGYGDAENYEADPTVMVDTVSPDVGLGEVGDRAINQNPAVGRPKGWICTVAGSPGTWVSEGNL